MQHSEKLAELFVLDDLTSSPCHFWVGLAKPGTSHMSQLAQLNSKEDCFDTLVKDGIVHYEPVLLADTKLGYPQYSYILPAPEKEVPLSWTQNLANTLRLMHPKQLGLYFAPELVTSEAVEELYSHVIYELMLTNSVSDFYIYTGNYEYNQLLNILFKIRNHLKNSKDMDLYIFH